MKLTEILLRFHCRLWLCALAVTIIPWPIADLYGAATAAQANLDSETRIIAALDKTIDLRVQDAPIRQALDQLGEAAGIPISMATGTTYLLPYGGQTKLTATISRRPLREALVALLRPLGLSFKPTGTGLIIHATPPLKRIGRRATWEDLATLEKLYREEWSEALFESLRFQFQDMASSNGNVNRETLRRVAADVGAGLAADVLERACDQQNWTWHPDGAIIAILTKTRQIERQLETRLSLRYTQASLTEALSDLANRADVLIRFDPGVLANLPPQTAERFSLSIENATVRQALEVIAGETGLGYVIEPEGVRMTDAAIASGPGTNGGEPTTMAAQAQVTAQATAAALRSNSIVGQLTFPMPDGSSFSFFVRQNDLPPEVDAMRKAKIIRAVNNIRQQLHREQPQD